MGDPLLPARVDAAFAPEGPLAKALPGFRARPSQVEMARAVADAIEARRVLVAEAGTGTGKTYAYLVPALLAGGKVLVSTGTKTLQDQLFGRDLPLLRDALGAPVTLALLKGRANYVCHHRLERAVAEGRFPTREEAEQVRRIERFAARTDSGDKMELPDVPENSPVWASVTSTRDNCLGQDCGHFKQCFVMEARRRAQQADVVVVNHHLFFADLMLRDEGVGELLPAANTVILDEAHQLPETAGAFFGESVSTSQLLELARDARLEAAASAPEYEPLPKACEALDKAAKDLRLAFPLGGGRAEGEGARRMAGAEALAEAAFPPALAALGEALAGLAKALGEQAERAPGLAQCQERALALGERLARWQAGGDDEDGAVRWVELYARSAQLHSTPLSVAGIFRRQLEGDARAWILTSATLSVKGDFSHYQAHLGLEDAATASWESPFDYPNQALLYVPQGLPDPNSRDYTAAVVKAALPLIRAARGRSFLLFTSLRAMGEGHRLLAEALAAEKLDYPLLLQGQGSRSELLARFRELPHAVLLGSQTFWEGVDVRGPQLSLVVIDRLPFAPPDDPVLAARVARMQREGRNPFMEHQLPAAVITLKQGAGRLIRDEGDRGVLAICDPRLVDKPYGKRIWRSLPPMRRSREEAEAVAFCASL